jgi:carboxylesterase
VQPHDASYFEHDCCKPFLHIGGDKGVLLLHGFTGSVAHMRPLGDALAERGYTVMGINLPGHATTERDMAQTGWKQWLAASREALLSLRTRCSAVMVAGLSMGGILSLILAQECLPDACVTLSAPLKTQNRWISLAGIAAPFVPRISWEPLQQRQQLNAAYDYGYSGFPTAKAADLNRLIGMARKNLHSVVCPVLAVQSTGDATIWPGSADAVIAGVSSDRKQKLMLKDVPHVCTLSVELPAIIDAMDTLLLSL